MLINLFKPKVISLVITVLVLSHIARAQESPKLDSAYIRQEMGKFFEMINEPKPIPVLYIELSTGLNSSLIARKYDYASFDGFDSPEIADNRTNNFGHSYNLGVNFSLILGDRFELGLGTAYSIIQSSAEYPLISGTEAGFGISLTELIEYIDVPITMKYHIKSGKLGVYALAGFSNSVMLSSTLSGSNTGSTTVSANDMDYSFLRKKWLGSLIGGIGVQRKSRTGGVFVEIRYAHGLNNITNGSNRYIDQAFNNNIGHIEGSSYMRNIQANLGYKFLITRKQ